ncbi:MAG: NAD-dependent epimerase/dehydratase family protein [Actinobacteria bacterium]|nr:NAD-dependent epimerase/dehydratase family protein [Actinomycetota bacterium]
MPSALIFGITGYAGSVLARHLARRGWRVRGLGRDEEAATDLEGLGVDVELGDVGDPEALTDIGHDGDHVFYLAGSVSGAAKWVRRVGHDGLVNACNALEGVAIASFTLVGTLAVYGAGGPDVLNEESPLRPNSTLGRVNLAGERLLAARRRAAAMPARIVRAGTIYGPGRDTVAALRERRLRLIGSGANHQSRIHVDDLARVLEAVAVAGAPGGAYLAVDDEPTPLRTYYDALAAALGLPPPRRTPRVLARALVTALGLSAALSRGYSPLSHSLYCLVTASYRCANTKIRGQLGVELHYPTYREGVASIVATLPAD